MKNLTDIATDVQSGKVSARSLVEQALSRADEKKQFNAIISTVRDRALQRADEIDQKIKDGQKVGRLAGVPFIAKDNFLAFGANTTAASNILKNFEAPYQATAIEKLEAEGAILVAKANLDAFAHGGSTENSDFGPTKNPHDAERVPGGSSGGSAASVALDIVPFALGTDTGGSIRQPASFCGVVGLKPTYGLTSRYGVIAMASSTDVIGPITRNVYDAALILDITAGKDERDSTLVERSRSYLPESIGAMRIGLIKEYMTDDVEPEVRERILSVAEKLRSLGHTVEEVSLPSLPLSLAVYYIVVPAEVSSNLARYDGVKYGLSDPGAKTLHEVYGKSRDSGFNDENKRRILIGTYVLSSGYYEAYYRKAQTVRTKLINEFSQVFESYDMLLGPVSPTPAFKIGERANDPLQMYLADVMTVASNLAGIPSISVPAGEVNGLPVGAQLIAPMRKDQSMLSLAAQLEEVL
jgi:aspartyl-tRNA(Asn)/glutamyl-tRNA(Gln) amidotransferase subunit A